MPVLSFYEGYSELSFCVFDDPTDVGSNKIYRFPYTYSNNLFANSFSREKFYKDVFALALKELNIEIKDYSLYAMGFLGTVDLPYKIDKNISVFSQIPPGYVYASSQAVAIAGKTYSYCLPTVETYDTNIRANLDLYHNIIFYDSRDIVLKDSFLRALLHYGPIEIPYDEVILTGDRFREFDLNPALGYLMAFDIIKNPGTFFLKMDTQNIFPHTILMGLGTLEYSTIGTLVNIPGKVECLFETDIATAQVFDLPENSIFIMPLQEGATARILIKSHETTVEKVVKGGKLGVIIDTRNKMKVTEFKEVYLNYIAQSMNRL